MNSITAIAVSGGVDSLTAAYLLKESEKRVIGLHFLTGFESESPNPTMIAKQLDIPVHTVDLRNHFKAQVVDYFVQTYLEGNTPNPCLVCNPKIKFGVLWQCARQYGAEYLATGHYARIVKSKNSRYHLHKGLDSIKDQSYFLAFLSQQQLSRTRFPLGGFTKSKVKEMASDLGLTPSTPSESQDVCFIRSGNYGDFLTQITGIVPQPGEIIDVAGNLVGRHQGLHLFTIGQRRGINCPAAKPYYVIRKDASNNRLIVGGQTDLYTGKCRIVGINWIQPPPNKAIAIRVRIRYRHHATPAKLDPQDLESAVLYFETPQKAVTPGQGAVFYDDDEVLGGGWIE